MFSDPNTAITQGDRSDTIEHINLLYVLYLCQQIQQQYACKLISAKLWRRLLHIPTLVHHDFTDIQKRILPSKMGP